MRVTATHTRPHCQRRFRQRARTVAAPLALAAALALTAFPAGAQTLTLGSGDNTLVSGAGTTTHVGSPSQATNPNATLYSSSTAGAATVTAGAGSVFTLAPGGTISYGGNGGGTILASGGAVQVVGGSVLLAPTASNAYLLGCGPGGSLTVTGGTLTGNSFQVGLFVTGGIAQMSGGVLTIPSGGAFSVSSGGVLDLFGTFTDGSGHALTSPITASGTGNIQGTFANGDPLARTFYAVNFGSPGGGTLEFNVGPLPSPEPTSWAALGLGALGLTGLAFRARRRRAA